MEDRFEVSERLHMERYHKQTLLDTIKSMEEWFAIVREHGSDAHITPNIEETLEVLEWSANILGKAITDIEESTE